MVMVLFSINYKPSLFQTWHLDLFKIITLTVIISIFDLLNSGTDLVP